jgi:hypothetical protein
MLNDIFQKAMGFLKQPAKAFEKESATDVTAAFKYMLVLMLVVAILSAAISLNALAFVGIYVFGIFGSVIVGLWLHLWAYIFGAKKGLNQTLKTVFYGGTPNYLLGWIPIINILASLYAIYLYWVGLKGLQVMPGDKALFAILIAIIIPMIILVVMGLLLLAALAPILGGTGGLGPGFPLPY